MKYRKVVLSFIVGFIVALSTSLYSIEKNKSNLIATSGKWFTCPSGKHVTGIHQNYQTGGENVIVFFIDGITCG